MEAIKTSELTKYYGKSRGVIDLDLTVGCGEYFGFIGPNGAGKSTTIRLLTGLIKPSSGGASVFGMDIGRESVRILERVGYLPSEAVFYPGMKAGEVLKLSARLRKKDCSAQAKELCERLSLDPSQKVDSLSFGNRKKVSIICALQSDPDLLILDEPTGGLDPLMQREFFDILNERHKKGRTIFLSSHILHEVQRNCTRAAVIKEGRIIACDSVEALSRTNAKRVGVHGKVDLAGLEGVKDLRITESGVTFLYSGELPPLLGRLSGPEVRDLNITDPDLDEIFLHYYEKEEKSQ